MPYNLPPPWDPGFAIPDNVRDEGLERRAYTTKWMPRGTYDDPRVRSGGYVVPQYVKDEGYGQGTFTTKWMPRGTYNGPRVPQWIQRQPRVVAQKSLSPNAAQVTFQRTGYNRGWSGFGDDAGGSSSSSLPDIYQQYGQRAAQAILTSIARVASPQRKQALKAIMDRVDPTLYKRTGDIIKQYVAQGLTATQAFPAALARALAAGIAAETVRLGQTGRAPQPNSLLGLGCYGCSSALGATPNFTALQSNVGFSQVAGAGGATAPANAPTAMAGKMAVGPLIVSSDPAHPQVVTITNPTLPTTGPWADFVAKFQSMAHNPALLSLASNKTQSALTGLTIVTAPQNPFWQMLGIPAGQQFLVNLFSPPATDGNWSDTDDGLAVPIVRFKHPVSGSQWGIFVSALPMTTAGGVKIYPTTSMQVYAKWLPVKSWATKAFDTIVSIPASILAPVGGAIEAGGQIVGDVVQKLGDLACTVAQKSGGLNGPAAAVAAKAGPGAAIGVAGAAVAATLCSTPQLPVYPVLPPSSSLLPLAIMGGVGLVAIVLMSKKKKGTTPP